MNNPWRMLSPREAAKQLGCSDQAVRRYFRSGILAGHKSGKFLFLDQRAVLALLAVIRQAKGEKPTPPARRGAAPAEGGALCAPHPDGITDDVVKGVMGI